MASAAPEIPALARDQAFELLYRRYVKDVYHYALALLRNPADAEDVTQTTFLNAYRAWQRGEEIEKPQNWLIKIAHNVARTRYARAARRVKEVPLEDHVEHLAVPEDERPNVEGVLRALGRLPFNQRAALVMRELEGRTYAEIADTIGVSVAAVETLIFRARRSLRLRASALRSLAAVPVPGSLAQVFEGGGLAAGGAALGTGFLVKAAVALLAGAVATGVGGGNTGPAAAAPRSTADLSSAVAVSAGSVRFVAVTHSSGVRTFMVKHPKAAHAAIRTGARPGASLVAREHARLSSAPASGTTMTATPSGKSTTPPADTEIVTSVTNLANQVEETVAAPASALPVETPTVPPLPVAPPPLPKLP
jgi:RNA polymerase sigma factor (sigma-70 family)